VASVYSAESKVNAPLLWEKTLEAAKEEGQVVLYTATDYDYVFGEFQKRYPGIKLVTWRGLGPDAIQRILSERRAGKFIPDLLTLGATSGIDLYKAKAFDPVEPHLILPEVIDRSKWWQGKHHYIDPEGKYIFNFNKIPRVEIAYNTNLVDPKEIKSYWDFLNPKWKSKIVVLDPMSGGAGTTLRFFYYNPEIGSNYLRRLLTEMDVTISRDGRQIADWLAQGRYAISMFISPTRMDLDIARKQGLPVHWFGPASFREGASLTAGPGNVYVFNRAPHPNAARVALNWLLAREGQIAAQKIMAEKSKDGMDSLRIDIPKDDIPHDSRRVDGVKYIMTDRPEWMDMRPIRNFIKEVKAAEKN
jgi:ABC-type Fe3+ transport system substrate-binding protein